MSSPTLTFTPAMFHSSRSGRKDTTRRVIAFPRDCISRSSTPLVPGLKGTPLKAPHHPGQIKPMVTTWAAHSDHDDLLPTELHPLCFEAAAMPENRKHIWFNDGSEKPTWAGKSRPGRFLPKSLYHLAPQVEILTVTPEFLRDITEASALREGIAKITKDTAERGDQTLWKYGLADRDGLPGTDNFGWPWNQWCLTARDAYFKLWDSINATRDEGQFASSQNPAVWVITYRIL